MFVKVGDRYINTIAIEQVIRDGAGATVYFRGQCDPLFLPPADAAALVAWLDTESFHLTTRKPEPATEPPLGWEDSDGPSEDDVESWYESATESDEVLWNLSVADIVRVAHVAYRAAEGGDSRAWSVRSRCAEVLLFHKRGERLTVLLGPLDEPLVLTHDPSKPSPFNLTIERALTLPELDDLPEYGQRPASEEVEV